MLELNSPYAVRPKGKRTKSQRDLTNQMYRIIHLSKHADSDPRVERAIEIADRYQENMMNTRRRKLDEAKYLRAYYSGDEEAMDAARKQIVDRQHSRRVYMGMSNG